MIYPSISTDQYNALITYARNHGRTWKSQLITDWMTGGCEGELQQIRNTHGPRWPKTFKVPTMSLATTKRLYELKLID